MVAPASNSRALARNSKASDTPVTPPPPQKPEPPTAEIILDFLRTSQMTPRQLAEHFQCSLRDIEAALDNPDFLLAHKLQQKLALLQSRLTAAEAVGHAVAKTVNIMSFAERPEVARRAASSLLQMAGLPTRTAPQDAPAPIPEPPPPPVTPVDMADAMDSLAAQAYLVRLKRVDGLDLEKIPAKLENEFSDLIRAFYDKHKIPYTWGDFGT